MATILLYPKLECPVGCEYCFSDPSVPEDIKYDKRAMVATLEEIATDPREAIVLHGGEVLSLPIKDFEFFLKSVRKLKNEFSIQTSLSVLSSEHIRLFRKYNTHIGVSVDGPPDLNALRGPRDSSRNAEYQKNLVKNMKRLRDEKIMFGTITILSKVNATGDNLDRLIEWAQVHANHGRFNPMFVPSWHPTLSQYQLSPSELKTAWIKLAEATLENPGFECLPVREWIDNLIGCGPLACCIVARCDYLTTMCKTIMPDGSLARCDRCFEQGFYLRAERPTQARAEVLKQTECAGCRYFDICGGGCPGEGEGGDPRRKTVFCEAYYGLYEFLEKRIKGLMPNIQMALDVPNYYDDFYMKGQRINFVGKMQNGTWRSPPPPDQLQQQQQDKPQNQNRGCSCGR